MSYSGRSSRRAERTLNSATDRRLACRYPAVIKALTLSTIETGALVDHSVELEDVSMQGCLLSLVETPDCGPARESGSRPWARLPLP